MSIALNLKKALKYDPLCYFLETTLYFDKWEVHILRIYVYLHLNVIHAYSENSNKSTCLLSVSEEASYFSKVSGAL